ncbi:MAG: DUF1003 domain-containing protein [Paracoccaceae bacterium]
MRAVGPELAAQMDRLHPGWRAGSVVCRSHLAEARRAHIDRLLAEDREEITALDSKVAEAIARNQSLVASLAPDGTERDSLGARVADRVAGFGGSWAFILGFTGVLLVWVAVNAVLASRAFDPFPFILLNLVLSCIAALQAPLIMMSQRRQEEKDRDRAQNDYLVNLKAEIEIRLLHEKLDHLMLQQLQHMSELQALMAEDAGSGRGDPNGH